MWCHYSLQIYLHLGKFSKDIHGVQIIHRENKYSVLFCMVVITQLWCYSFVLRFHCQRWGRNLTAQSSLWYSKRLEVRHQYRFLIRLTARTKRFRVVSLKGAGTKVVCPNHVIQSANPNACGGRELCASVVINSFDRRVSFVRNI